MIFWPVSIAGWIAAIGTIVTPIVWMWNLYWVRADTRRIEEISRGLYVDSGLLTVREYDQLISPPGWSKKDESQYQDYLSHFPWRSSAYE